jgi:hypothetical protein
VLFAFMSSNNLENAGASTSAPSTIKLWGIWSSSSEFFYFQRHHILLPDTGSMNIYTLYFFSSVIYLFINVNFTQDASYLSVKNSANWSGKLLFRFLLQFSCIVLSIVEMLVSSAIFTASHNEAGFPGLMALLIMFDLLLQKYYFMSLFRPFIIKGLEGVVIILFLLRSFFFWFIFLLVLGGTILDSYELITLDHVG